MKDTVSRLKDKSLIGRKYLQKTLSDKRCVSKLYREHLQFHNKKTNKQIKNRSKRVEQTPSEKRSPTDKHMNA